MLRQLVKSAAMALKENIEPYFTETTFEEDGEEVLRPLWHYPVAEGILGTVLKLSSQYRSCLTRVPLVTDGTEDSTPSNIVSHLCGRDSMALDPALTRDAMCVEMSWILKVPRLFSTTCRHCPTTCRELSQCCW
jgi:hypothetical protein